MDLFEELKKKYNKRAQDNMPQIVYAPPEIMRRMRKGNEESLQRKYNVEPSDNIPYEVYGTPDSMRKMLPSNNEEILFRYSKQPSYGKRGNPGGHSITVYTNKKVVCEEYLFGYEKSHKQTKKYISDQDLDSILNIMLKYAQEITDFTDELSVMDGTMYEFRFGKKIIRRDDASACGVIKTIADEILAIVERKDNKYNVDPRENVPQKVYGVPKPDSSLKDKIRNIFDRDEPNDWPDKFSK